MIFNKRFGIDLFPFVLESVISPQFFLKTQKIHSSKEKRYSPVRLKYFLSVWGFFTSFSAQFHSQAASLAVKQPPRDL